MLVLANIAGAVYAFFRAYWKYVVAGLVVLIVAGIVFRSCGSKPKFNEAEIRKAQQAIAENDRRAMVEVLTESEVREQQIDNTLANAELQKLKAINESRKKYAQMSNEELAAELESRK